MKIEIHSLQETQEFATKMADLCRNKQLVITLGLSSRQKQH